MRMKRKRRNKREMMDLMELSREMTRLRSDDQYLERPHDFRSRVQNGVLRVW
jgi:hypothetical protein